MPFCVTFCSDFEIYSVRMFFMHKQQQLFLQLSATLVIWKLPSHMGGFICSYAILWEFLQLSTVENKENEQVWIHGCLLKLISLNGKIITRVLSNKNVYNSLWSIFSRQDIIQEVHDLHIQYLVARKKNVLNLKGNRHVLLWKTSHRISNKGKIPVKWYGLDVVKLDFFKQWTNIQVFF